MIVIKIAFRLNCKDKKKKTITERTKIRTREDLKEYNQNQHEQNLNFCTFLDTLIPSY